MTIRIAACGLAWLALLRSLLAEPAAGSRVDFSRDVKPLLDSRCTSCHGAVKQKGGLRLDAASLLLKGGKHGPAATAHDAASSGMISRLTSKDEDERMPPEGKPLTEHEIQVFRDWINAGAPVPKDEEIPASPADHWFFKPPVKVPLPVVAGQAKRANPIDRWLAAGWRTNGLKPQAQTDKATLLRRVHLDLVGVPPTVDELAAFQRDSSRDAYEKVVDRLLEDSRYGQRWARHFMDIWRYTDEVLDPCGSGDPMFAEYHMWRWRDWIVESLNQNKPYDAMIREQLAGDEISPGDHAVERATGFLVRNHNSLNGKDFWLTETVEHTSQAFMGLTMKCARCHDHKYDPIPQLDYYRMRAVFEPIGKRIDFIPGFANVRSNGIPRIYDENPHSETFLFVNGNPQDRKKENLPAAVPTLLGAGTLDVHAVPLPARVTSPISEAGIQETFLADARAQVAAAQSSLRESLAAVEAQKLSLAVVEIAPDQPYPQPGDSAEKEVILNPAEAAARHGQAKLRAAQANLEAIEKAITADQAALTNEAAASPLKALATRAIRTKELRIAEALVAAKRADLAREGYSMVMQNKDAETNSHLKDLRDLLGRERKKLETAIQKQASETNYVSLWKSYPTASSGRRLAFAKWLTGPTNPAPARVLVNHVWMRHFGRPLVETVFDFGLHGRKPINPELLDWLAVDFVQSGWDLKRLHKLIVTSRAYQMSSARLPGSRNESIDPENRFLWRMNPQRMQAEQIRDSILATAGNLDLTSSGPSIPTSESDRNFRRSVYFCHTADGGDKMLRMFDAADPNECYRRNESVAPQQALVLANSRFSHEQARRIAASIKAKEDVAYVKSAFVHVLGRPPSQEESRLCAEYLKAGVSDESAEARLAEEKNPMPAASADPAQRIRESLIHVLLNHTDFVTIR